MFAYKMRMCLANIQILILLLLFLPEWGWLLRSSFTPLTGSTCCTTALPNCLHRCILVRQSQRNSNSSTQASSSIVFSPETFNICNKVDKWSCCILSDNEFAADEFVLCDITMLFFTNGPFNRTRKERISRN